MTWCTQVKTKRVEVSNGNPLFRFILDLMYTQEKKFFIWSDNFVLISVTLFENIIRSYDGSRRQVIEHAIKIHLRLISSNCKSLQINMSSSIANISWNLQHAESSKVWINSGWTNCDAEPHWTWVMALPCILVTSSHGPNL